MSVESSASKLREKADGDVNRRVKGALQDKREAIEPELERIRQSLIMHRANRDTVNHPTVEMASSDRKGAIRRRMQKNTTPKRDGKLAKSAKNPIHSDSGTPDDASADIAGTGDSGGGDSGASS
jgi:hypothetical protein